MAYDFVRGRLVMFGGVNRARDPYVYFSDTWEWDGRTWYQVSIGSGPSARAGHAMAYDTARRRVVLLGGASRGSGGDPGIWEWDGSRWRRIAPTSPSPSPGKAKIAYDPRRDRMVLIDFSNTWEWDGGQRTWTKLAPTGTMPPGRTGYGMTYDPARGRVVLYGGMELNDLWEWDGAAKTWSLIEPANTPPPPGSVEAMFYDLAQQKVVMVRSVSDIWTWDGGTRLWSHATTTAPLPDPGTKFSMAYIPPAGSAILFGGGMGNRDTWLWSGTAWTAVVGSGPSNFQVGALAYDPNQARLLGVRGAPIEIWEGKKRGLERDLVWTQLVTTGAVPGALEDFVFDPRRQRIFAFRKSLNEAWEWNGSQWGMIAAPPSGGLSFSSVLYDPIDRRIQIFGGSYLEQVTWDGVRWQRGAMFGSHRFGAALAVDPVRKRTVLFGGWDRGLTMEETYELSDGWAKKSPGQSPQPTDHGKMIYDPGRRRTILVADSRTWEWDGEDWLDITPVTPGPSNVGGLFYDPMRQAVIADGLTLRYESQQTPDERCHSGIDVDRDGLIGCADPDCWAYCSPFCPPGQTCDAADPHCGDGTCSVAVETCQACPVDCGACPSVCGDYACTAGESAANCPGDCP